MNKTFLPSSGEYEEWDREENTKYKIEIHNSAIRVARRIYPLRGYGNYEELVVELKILRKYASIEVYYLRNSWNGSGYFPVCQEKVPRNVFDDIIHNTINKHNIHDVKSIWRGMFEMVGNHLKEMEKCPGAVWVLFSPPS